MFRSHHFLGFLIGEKKSAETKMAEFVESGAVKVEIKECSSVSISLAVLFVSGKVHLSANLSTLHSDCALLGDKKGRQGTA